MAETGKPLSAAPQDRRYSREHEWAQPEADGVVRVGITDYAAHELGDVVYVQLPDVGSKVTQFMACAEIESVKAVSELFAPVSGEVIEVNQAVVDEPEQVNTAPFEGGWMLRVRMSSPAELDALLSAADYVGYLQRVDSEGAGH